MHPASNQSLPRAPLPESSRASPPPNKSGWRRAVARRLKTWQDSHVCLDSPAAKTNLPSNRRAGPRTSAGSATQGRTCAGCKLACWQGRTSGGRPGSGPGPGRCSSTAGPSGARQGSAWACSQQPSLPTRRFLVTAGSGQAGPLARQTRWPQSIQHACAKWAARRRQMPTKCGRKAPLLTGAGSAAQRSTAQLARSPAVSRQRLRRLARCQARGQATGEVQLQGWAPPPAGQQPGAPAESAALAADAPAALPAAAAAGLRHSAALGQCQEPEAEQPSARCPQPAPGVQG